jgi:2-polyprenyl-3-methyl-5-hydroxy-6-metoxy-1,4-benzoquinol methylase
VVLNRRRRRQSEFVVNKNPKFYEDQYDIINQTVEKHGIAKMGLMANESWNNDPKRTLFTLSRYKFVSRLVQGRKKVLEVGCADAFGTRIVQQASGSVKAIDIDPVLIDDAKARMNPHWAFEVGVHNMLEGPVSGGPFDAAYALDVLEHIKPADEDQFLKNMVRSLDSTGVAILGMPSLESQVYASPQSKAGHVNCKCGKDFNEVMSRYFNAVFMFSMNDEVVHTGYFPMAHYLLAVCAHKKEI